MIDKINSVPPDEDSLKKERERIVADLAALDKLMAQKEDEYNRLLYLSCIKKELHERMERKERLIRIKDLLPILINKCGTKELSEVKAMLEEEIDSPMASKHSLSAIEKLLNYAELNQNIIQLLRG